MLSMVQSMVRLVFKGCAGGSLVEELLAPWGAIGGRWAWWTSPAMPAATSARRGQLAIDRRPAMRTWNVVSQYSVLSEVSRRREVR